MQLDDLLFVMREVPLPERARYAAYYGLNTSATLTGYHVTASANLAHIQQEGLLARSSQQGFNERPAAVYFFYDRTEITPDVIAQLGIHDPVIISITFPVADLAQRGCWDGLWNVTFDTVSAIQYRANVPAAWLSVNQ